MDPTEGTAAAQSDPSGVDIAAAAYPVLAEL
jgi:hypothetical protein